MSPSKPLNAPLRRSLSTRRSLVPDPAAFLPDLTAFLASMDPSLIPLAQPFLAAGISSLRFLASFSLLEPDSRMALYEEMQESAGVEVTDEQVALLEQALDELRVDKTRL